MVGTGEALIIGLICCFLGGSGLGLGALVFFLVRKKDGRGSEA